MTSKVTLLTQEGLNDLQEELRILKEERRIEIAEKLKEAISYGDLSENAEYQTARDEQAQMELRISELEELLKPGNYELIKHEWRKKKSGINVGSTVIIRNAEWEEFNYTIVGSQEANILEGKISNESPLGKTLIGKEKDDVFEVQVPSGKAKYTIISA